MWYPCALILINELIYYTYCYTLGLTHHKLGKFHWAKLSQYPQLMDFLSNTFAVQGQGTYAILYLY